MITVTSVPDQMISLAKKKANDFQHYKDTLEAYLTMSKFKHGTSTEDLLTWYKVFNGEKIDGHYSGFEDPFGTKSTTNPLPLNDVKPWNIIRANGNIIINEKEKRPWNYQAVVKNPDAVSARTVAMEEEIKKTLTQNLINLANENGVNTGVESKPVQNVQDLALKYEMDYIDKRAIEAQKILRIAVSEERVQEKLNRIGMKHWVIAGEINTYKGMRQNDLVYEVINPIDIDFIGSPDNPYGRDKEAAVYRKMMPLSKIVDNFRDLMTEKELLDLSANNDKPSNAVIDYTRQQFVRDQNTDATTGSMKEVIHSCWRSYKKVGYISYLDEFEEKQTIEVDQTFDKKLFGYDIVNEEWEWLTCIDEVYRIDGDIFIGAGEVPYTSRKLSNPSLTPLPYNQAKFSELNTTNTSLVKEAYIYQFYWNIYKAKMERLIAVDKGQVTIIDKAVLAQHGLGSQDIDQAMYYMETQHILWLDSRRDDMGKFQQWGAKLDFSQHNAVASILNVLLALRQELDLHMGITPQRRGEINSSAGKATTEMALAGAYSVSEGVFVDYENFEEQELNDIINIAKIVYSKNKKGMYIVDGMPLYLDLEGWNIEEEELGVYMSKATKDKVKLDAMRTLTQPFAQNVGKNGITPEMIGSMVKSDSISEIELAMKRADTATKQYEEQIRKHEQEMQQQQLEAAAKEQQEARAFESQENALDREARVKEASIRASGFEPETLVTDIDTTKITAEANKARQALDKSNIDREKLAFEKQKHEDDVKVKREEMKNKIAIENKKLKNPVSGEKRK